MYLADDPKLLYVHIPKTGGSAVRDLLSGLGLTRLGDRHNSLSSIDDPEEYKDHFCFTVVRNPYNRLISMYRFNRVYAMLDPPKFVRRWGDVPLEETPLRSFCEFVKDRATRPIPITQVDFIRHDTLNCEPFKYENGAHDLLQRRFNLPKPASRDADTHYLGDYPKPQFCDQAGLDFISEHCAEDFHVFGYERVSRLEQLG